jgi:lysophospholipase L1-like esterase
MPRDDGPLLQARRRRLRIAHVKLPRLTKDASVTRILLIFCVALLGACVSQPVSRPVTEGAAQAVDAGDSMRFEPEIVAFEQADSVVRRRPGSVVFVGSSSIRLWDSIPDDFPGIATINRGFGGSRVRDSTYFADRIVTPYHPKAIVFYAGDNDLMEGRTPRQVRDDFAAFVAKVREQAPKASIGFIAIKPSPSRADLLPRIREANTLVREYAQQAPGVDYLDVYLPMLDAQGQPRAELFVEDQLHMNASGYAIWTGVVRPWLTGLQ